MSKIDFLIFSTSSYVFTNLYFFQFIFYGCFSAFILSRLMKDELTNHLISVSKDAEDLLNTLMENYKNTDERLSEKNKKINTYLYLLVTFFIFNEPYSSILFILYILFNSITLS